jgi:RNA polymerase sigma factor (sigma-70 family)
MTTNELLRRYVAERSEAAFAELVRQHIDLVYSAALRQVSGDAATAQDVTQAVFTELARNAPHLVKHRALTGWLYTSTRFLAAKTRRAEHRRQAREQEAHLMNQLLQPSESDLAWQEFRPLLDDVMHELDASDREAVLMRYFERQPLAEVGARLGLSENTARMRVERALDKLRAALARRGVTSTVAALGGALAERAVCAAPVELAGQVSHAAFGTVAAGGSAGVGVLKFLASTESKLLVAAGATALVAGLLLVPRLTSSGPARTASPPLEKAAAADLPAPVAPIAPAPPTPFAAVYSPDLKTFAANLRAIHCPEETVKDILTAEVHRRFKVQEQTLLPTPADHVPLGWSARTTEPKLLERRQRATALAHEQAALLREALGYDVPVPLPVYAITASDQRSEETLAAVPAETRKALLQAQETYWAGVQALQERTKGFWLAADVADLQRLKDQRKQAVQALLPTPAEAPPQ